jgi:hypothetical protein
MDWTGVSQTLIAAGAGLAGVFLGGWLQVRQSQRNIRRSVYVKWRFFEDEIPVRGEGAAALTENERRDLVARIEREAGELLSELELVASPGVIHAAKDLSALMGTNEWKEEMDRAIEENRSRPPALQELTRHVIRDVYLRMAGEKREVLLNAMREDLGLPPVKDTWIHPDSR